MIYNISTVFSHFSLLCNTKCDTDSRMNRMGEISSPIRSINES